VVAAARSRRKEPNINALLGSSKAGLSTGTVHVYNLTTDGHPIDSLHVAEACKPEQIVSLLSGRCKG